MTIFADLQPRVRAAGRMVLRRDRRRASVVQARDARPGPPPGIPDQVLDQVAVETGLGRILTVAHVHLSGWKLTGAYRVMLTTREGPSTLIFKDARYSSDQISALEGLPVRPGRPEHAVYQRSADLGRWVPECRWSTSSPDGHRFRYLLEDLAPTLQRPAGPDAVDAVVRFLPALHGDLTNAFRGARTADLLDYGDDFVDGLLHYVRRSLESLASTQSRRGPSRGLLKRWDRVEQVYRAAGQEARAAVPQTVVHGDVNLANVLTRADGSALRLVDWEWAGKGLPHMDLAALLKTRTPADEVRVLGAYHAATGVHPVEGWRAYQWCKLQRALLDAGFLAKQRMGSGASADFDLDAHIRPALARAHVALRALRT